MKCPLCGFSFEREVAESACAAGCRLWKECDLVRCPNCYYENVTEPEWYAELARPTQKIDTRTLAEWPVGRQAVIKSLKTDDRQALQKMIAMGLFRGSFVELIANYPSFVFKIQNQTFAIDRELANRVVVEGK